MCALPWATDAGVQAAKRLAEGMHQPLLACILPCDVATLLTG